MVRRVESAQQEEPGCIPGAHAGAREVSASVLLWVDPEADTRLASCAV